MQMRAFDQKQGRMKTNRNAEEAVQMKQEMTQNAERGSAPVGRVAGWLLGRLRTVRAREPRLALVERIALAPRQSLALVEAEGRRFLVATSPEGAPAFYALDDRTRLGKLTKADSVRQTARVSW